MFYVYNRFRNHLKPCLVPSHHFCAPVLPQAIEEKNSININNVTSHMSILNHSQTVTAKDLIFWHQVHHNLWFLCPLSHVYCHLSFVTIFLFIFLQIAWVSRWRVCYQWGLPCLVFRPFCVEERFDTQCLHILACKGPVLIIKTKECNNI